MSLPFFGSVITAGTSNPPPVAPTNLVAVANGGIQIDLTWDDNASSEDEYEVERHNGDGNWVLDNEATLPANTNSFSSTGLAPGSQHFYRVRALSILGGPSAYSNTDDATTVGAIPDGDPTGLVAVNAGSGQVDLSWNDNASNETNYGIERTLTLGTFVEIDTTPGPNINNYTDSTVVVETAYDYRVRARNGIGDSAYSNVVTITTLPNPPAAPSSLVATGFSSIQIDLTWVDNSTNEAEFLLERRELGDDEFVQIISLSAGATSHSDIVPSGSYDYRIRARNGGGDSAYSNTANGSTVSVPNRPTGIVAVWSGPPQLQVLVSWLDNSSNEANFELDRRYDLGAWSNIIDPIANSIFYVDIDFAGTLTAPGNLLNTGTSETSISVSWLDVAGEDGYVIEHKLSSDITWIESGTVNVGVTTFTITGLVSGSQYDIRIRAFLSNSVSESYQYRIRAVNGSGNSPYSEFAEVEVPREDGVASAVLIVSTDALTIPAAPSSLSVTTISSIELQLGWVDNSNNEDTFRIERGPTSLGPWAEIDSTTANTYNDGALTPSTEYFYRVRARNVLGNSNYSNVDSATTNAGGPV